MVQLPQRLCCCRGRLEPHEPRGNLSPNFVWTTWIVCMLSKQCQHTTSSRFAKRTFPNFLPFTNKLVKSQRYFCVFTKGLFRMPQFLNKKRLSSCSSEWKTTSTPGMNSMLNCRKLIWILRFNINYLLRAQSYAEHYHQLYGHRTSRGEVPSAEMALLGVCVFPNQPCFNCQRDYLAVTVCSVCFLHAYQLWSQIPIITSI